MGSRVKTGPIEYYSRGIFTKKWREGWFALYEDSTIQWFEKESDHKPAGHICIKEVCQFLSVGPYTRCVPGRPSLPSRGDENLLICIPKDYKKKEKDILWLHCRDLSELNNWMKAIVSTLPPPPMPPKPPGGNSTQPLSNNSNQPASNPSAPPKSPTGFRPDPQPRVVVSRPENTNINNRTYPINNNMYEREAAGNGYYQNNEVHDRGNSGIPASGPHHHTTVIVQAPAAQEETRYVPQSEQKGGKYSGTDLALGMLAGAAIGGSLGWAWSSNKSGNMGYGMGSGWTPNGNVYGSGYGGGYGNNGGAPDYTINNYYNTDIRDNDTLNQRYNSTKIDKNAYNFNALDEDPDNERRNGGENGNNNGSDNNGTDTHSVTNHEEQNGEDHVSVDPDLLQDYGGGELALITKTIIMIVRVTKTWIMEMVSLVRVIMIIIMRIMSMKSIRLRAKITSTK